jgi:hypothetical protein
VPRTLNPPVSAASGFCHLWIGALLCESRAAVLAGTRLVPCRRITAMNNKKISACKVLMPRG